MVQFGEGTGVELRSIMTPTVNIGQGQSFEVVLDLYNHSSVIVGDPDGCSRANTPCNGKDGYCIEAVVEVSGSQKTVTKCLNLPETGIPPNNEKWSVTLPAPDQDGLYTVNAYARTTNSGNRSPAVTSNITVSGDREDVPDEGDGGGGNNDGDGGDNGNGSGVISYILNNPGKAAIIGGGSAFVIDRSLKHVLEE